MYYIKTVFVCGAWGVRKVKRKPASSFSQCFILSHRKCFYLKYRQTKRLHWAFFNIYRRNRCSSPHIALFQWHHTDSCSCHNVPLTFSLFLSVQYLPQLTSSTVFPAVDNKRYYNLRKFNYHLPNIWSEPPSPGSPNLSGRWSSTLFIPVHSFTDSREERAAFFPFWHPSRSMHSSPAWWLRHVAPCMSAVF